jgi:hypothetical protein
VFTFMAYSSRKRFYLVTNQVISYMTLLLSTKAYHIMCALLCCLLHSANNSSGRAAMWQS